MSNKLPNFILAGFPKCGSTSLYYYLKEHPEIFLPNQKELHFFTYDILQSCKSGPGDSETKKTHVKNLNEYGKHYSDVKNEMAIGDTSPSYINYPSIIPEIKKTLGNNLKIIIILRDPIKRAYSNYLHLAREHRESLQFYNALMAEESRKKQNYSDFWYYTFNSSYSQKIKEFKKEFDDVLVITFEEFISNPRDYIKEVYKFLNVDEHFLPKDLHVQFNEGGVFSSNPITKFIFKPSRFKTFLKKNIVITPKMKQAKLNIIKRFKKPTPKIEQKAEEYLINFFKEEVSLLKNNYGVKTEFWNKAFNENLN